MIAWVNRCGHAVARILQGLSRKASRSAVNPPWLAYRYMPAGMRAAFRTMSDERGF